MPRVNGVYSLPPIYFAENGTIIIPNQHNIPFEDVAAALTGSLPRDGSANMTGNLRMNGRKVVGMADGESPQDGATVAQLPVLSPFVKSISDLNMVADRIIYSLNSTTAAMAVLSGYMRTSLASANAAEFRNYISAAGLNTATQSSDGLMSSADKTKLNGISAGAQANVPTNLGNNVFATNVSITSSTGTNTLIPRATATEAGVMAGADKAKLDGIAAGAQVNLPTNLGNSVFANSVTVTSSTGTNTTIPRATATEAGVMAGADKAKLDGIAAGAQVNVPTNLGYTASATNGVVTSSTGINTTIPTVAASNAGLMLPADKTKLDGIAAGAGVTAALATQAQAEAGTNSTATMTPLRTEQHMLANAFGWGQTYQNVAGSRARNTSYQNTTGRPIDVYIDFTAASATNVSFEVSSNNSTWVPLVSTSSANISGSFRVTNDTYYRLSDGSPAAGTINRWIELR